MDTKDEQRSDESTPPGGGLRWGVRYLMGVFAAVLFFFGMYVVWRGIDQRTNCIRAEAAKVLDVAIDVGIVGQHRVPMTQTYSFTCKQEFRLVPEMREGENAKDLLSGLELKLTAEGGHEWWTYYPPPMPPSNDEDAGVIERCTPLSVGEYTILVEVTNPAPALAGRPVRLVSEYALCGLEWMGVRFLLYMGAATAVLGLTITWVLYITRLRA